LRSGVIRRQLCGDRGGSEEPSKLALTISWAVAGPGSIPSVTPPGRPQSTDTLLAMLLPRLGRRGKGTRGAEVLTFSAPLSLTATRAAVNPGAARAIGSPNFVGRLHSSTGMCCVCISGSRSGLAEKLAKSASTDPQTLLSHSKPLNKRNNFRMRGRLLPHCYPVRQGALSCGRGARSAPA
jgi:hypothetical protein